MAEITCKHPTDTQRVEMSRLVNVKPGPDGWDVPDGLSNHVAIVVKDDIHGTFQIVTKTELGRRWLDDIEADGEDSDSALVPYLAGVITADLFDILAGFSVDGHELFTSVIPQGPPSGAVDDIVEPLLLIADRVAREMLALHPNRREAATTSP